MPTPDAADPTALTPAAARSTAPDIKVLLNSVALALLCNPLTNLLAEPATASVTSITSSTATSGGTITSDGGASVTSRGLVWGTSSGASTYSVTSGSGTGTFTSSTVPYWSLNQTFNWSATVSSGATGITGNVTYANTANSISGSLTSGSADNIRWEVVNSNTGSGTFDLLIRQGNDLANSKSVLETWTNLSLDPKSP